MECKCEKAGMDKACGACTKPDWLKNLAGEVLQVTRQASNLK